MAFSFSPYGHLGPCHDGCGHSSDIPDPDTDGNTRSHSDTAEPVSRPPATDAYPFFPYGYTCSNCNPAIYTDNPINTDTCPLCNSGQLECFRKPDSDAGGAQPSVKVPADGYAATDGVSVDAAR